MRHLSITTEETEKVSISSKLDETSHVSSTRFLKVMRLGVLFLLWIQISFSILVVDYSRNIRKEKYSNSDVVILSESVKFIISAVIILLTGADSESNELGEVQAYSLVQTHESEISGGDLNGNCGGDVDVEATLSSPSLPSLNASSRSLTKTKTKIDSSLLQTFHTYFRLIKSSKKMVLIVVLYAVSNVVALTAVEYLGSGVYNTVTQLKILSTAAFGKFCLNREYSSAKWRALLLLVLGCILVASPRPEDSGSVMTVACTHEEDGASPSGLEDEQVGTETTRDMVTDGITSNVKKQLIGLVCTGIQVSISGFNSVYLESLLKMDRCSIWGRNFQMAFMSIIVLVTSTFIFRSTSSTHRFLDHWSWCATFVVLIQSAGGLLVAASLKYADAVIKCFASAMSIMFTLLVAYIFLGGYFSLVTFIGCVVTIVSLFNYILDTSLE